jgi:hypothetical protein
MMAPGFMLTAVVSLHAAFEYWRDSAEDVAGE